MTPSLRELLAAAPNRRMSVRQFIERALYDAEFGYYSRSIRSVGARGDFSTSATLSHTLGRAVARWIEAELPRFDSPPSVIEAGAGDGAMAEAVIRSLGLRNRRKSAYRIVEPSAPLRALQQRRLGNMACWHASMIDGLSAAEGQAIVIMNEVADAFPPTLLRWDAAEHAWDEVWIDLDDDGRILERARPPDAPVPPAAALEPAAWPDTGPPDGQRVEVHFSFRDWLREWAPAASRLSILTVDYGDIAADLYRRRPAGTLRGYWQHVRVDGAAVYRRIGRQDLTADVNFSDLAAWGDELGLASDPLMTQREFLEKWGRRELRPRPEDVDAFLSNESGAGSAFKVLAQRF